MGQLASWGAARQLGCAQRCNRVYGAALYVVTPYVRTAILIVWLRHLHLAWNSATASHSSTGLHIALLLCTAARQPYYLLILGEMADYLVAHAAL